MNFRYTAVSLALLTICPVSKSFSASIPDDVFYSSGPYKGWSKIRKSKMTGEQRAVYQEHYRDEIMYCLDNWGKKAKDINPERNCTTGGGDSPVSYYMIALKYMQYGDQVKAAEYYYKDWVDSIENPNWQPFSGDADELAVVISGYESAGLYESTLPFYEKYYAKLIARMKISTDEKLLNKDFAAYKRKWPEMAKEYSEFMRNWKTAKILAKTERPKPLEEAVLRHEWFYSDKAEEVLNALGYYHANKVGFMLEKALSHKDPKVAAKAKEYLEDLKKGDKNETGKKQP